MLARSTAWRHGEGRTWTKKASTSSTLPSRTIRLAGLMSRWARPASHSWRTSRRPLSITWSSTWGGADLLGAGEELHHDQVLAFGGDLHEPERRRHRDAHVAQPQQRVVLVLDEAAHRLEGRLVLQGAVQDGAAQLVGPVGAHVAFGVQLGEQVTLGLGVAGGHPQPQRGRPRRTLQADRLDVQDRQPELLLDGRCGWPAHGGHRHPGARPWRAGR